MRGEICVKIKDIKKNRNKKALKKEISRLTISIYCII